VDAKDSYTRSHSETVSETCGLIAEELGLAPERVARLRLAGLLHDIGKIGIPDAILQKPSALTDEEFEVMKTHSKLGYRIVRGAELEQEAEWILHHHERPDGRGYPDGLRGDELPLESRIILVADAFEAMTSDRPYRRGQSECVALAELTRCSGSQFDPDCVEALHRAVAAPSDQAVASVTAA
jgi:putative nucleotidyltransferase with HDIG domain